jgi:hypothetical protein
MFAAILLYLFYFAFLFSLILCHIQFNLALYRRGIDNPSFALGVRSVCLCAGAVHMLFLGSPIGRGVLRVRALQLSAW